MTSAYGMQVWYADGSTTVSPDTQTVLFVGTYTAAAGASPTYTFTTVPAGGLLVFPGGLLGNHTYAVGSSGGNATLSFTATSGGSGSASTLDVFCNMTNEPDYGVVTFNAAGQRMFSTLFPVPEFLGKVTFGAGSALGTSGVLYLHAPTTTVSTGGRRTMTFWNMPSSSDVWIRGDSSASGLIIRSATGSYTVPEALIVAADNTSASSESYGLRIWDASGTLTFDSGRKHVQTLGVEAIPYPSGGSSFTSAFLPGAFTIPEFHEEDWVSSGLSSNADVYDGYVQRNGTTITGRKFRTGGLHDDSIIDGDFAFGVEAGAGALFIDATLYGGTYFA